MASSLLLLLLVCFSSSAVSSPLTVLSKPSAYDVLQSYGFPVGLLPKGATGYDLDSSSGEFSAYLDGDCSFSIKNSYQLRYQSTISGTISTNRLYNLKGVSVKILFFWINIIEVVHRDGALEFSVGIASADFTEDNFFESPQCGCGFDCVGGAGDGARIKLRVPA
ncbi:At5g01610-like protein [Dioscorea alata]|uniref:At5g01610-like protein n=1 Tax=Dioscorea alata TaxID=55571 RepID=A0ACB7VQB2_DIOAL|nr:At5g01610-like protein [Dioscorea alata]